MARCFPNDNLGWGALRNWLLRHGVKRVVLKPTKCFHPNLHQCLGDASLETLPVNSLRFRRFAEDIGVLAKNDRVSAVILIRFGFFDRLQGTPALSNNLLLLSDLLAIRRKHRDEPVPELRAGADAPVDGMHDATTDCDGRIQQSIAAAKLARRAAIVESFAGIGPVNAARLCANRPELVRLDRRQATSHFGIDPFDADSGGHCGARFVACSKSHQVAVVAIMRRRVTCSPPCCAKAGLGKPGIPRGCYCVIFAPPSRESRLSEHSSVSQGLDTEHGSSWTSAPRPGGICLAA